MMHTTKLQEVKNTQIMDEDFSGVIRLTSGFTLDARNLYGESKISHEDIKDFSSPLQKAIEGLEQLRREGILRGVEGEKILFTRLPYLAENTPNTKQSLQHIKEVGARLQKTTDIVISMGIGGSYLGAKVIFDAFAGDFWNLSPQKRHGRPKIFFAGNNLDPLALRELVRYVEEVAEKKGKLRLAILVISKSGSTLDTIASFLAFYAKLQKNSHLTIETILVTEEASKNPLTSLAKAYGFAILNTPREIGGRFSVFTTPGLIIASIIGFPLEDFLRGARDMEEATKGADIRENPALFNALLKHIASEKYGKTIEVFMPYRQALGSLADWYVQLLAESLGKLKTREGKIKHTGRTPVPALGTTDMHAQTQEHQEGKLDKIIQFVQVEEWEEDLTIENIFPEVEEFSSLQGIHLSELMKQALLANAEALKNDDRWNITIKVPRLNAYTLGELMYFLAISTIYEGELLDVNAFDQPGVEAYKKYMKKYIRMQRRN